MWTACVAWCIVERYIRRNPATDQTAYTPVADYISLYAQDFSHHAALPHIRVGAGRSDLRFRDAVDERSSVRVLLPRHAVGCVPRRYEGVLEVEVAAVSTDLSIKQDRNR